MTDFLQLTLAAQTSWGAVRDQLEPFLGSVDALPSQVVLLIVGGLLVMAGRRLWVLAVAFGGFALGWWAASQMGLSRIVLGSDTVEPFADPALWFGLIAGLACAVLCLALQRLVVSVAGFLAGALVALFLLRTLAEAGIPAPGAGAESAMAAWLPLVLIAVGGMVGAFASGLMFRFALVVATSLIGAVLIVRALPLVGEVALVAAGALALVGLVVQGRGRKPESRKERRARRRSLRAG